MAPLLEPPQAADEGQEGRLAGTRLARHDHDLARIEVEIVVLEDHGGRLALPEGVADVADPDPRDRPGVGLEVRGTIVGGRHRVKRHRKSSAGSAEKSLRMAKWAETTHMTTVNTSTSADPEDVHPQGEPRQPLEQEIEAVGGQQPREEAQDGQPEPLPQDDRPQEGVAVAYRLERGVLRRDGRGCRWRGSGSR